VRPPRPTLYEQTTAPAKALLDELRQPVETAA
jgi:hypothetical protein